MGAGLSVLSPLAPPWHVHLAKLITTAMLALSCLSVGLVPHAAVRTRPLVHAQPPLRVARRAPPPQAHAAAIYESSQMATTVQLGLDPTVVSDTLLDLGVYGLLALTVGLTLYSIYVTLDESNKKARPTPSTLTPTGLPTVRAGYAHQPAACCCTHRRRREACLGGPRTARTPCPYRPLACFHSQQTGRRAHPYP